MNKAFTYYTYELCSNRTESKGEESGNLVKSKHGASDDHGGVVLQQLLNDFYQRIALFRVQTMRIQYNYRKESERAMWHT